MGPEQSLGAMLLLLQLQSSLLLSLSWGATPVLASLLENSLQNYTFSHTLFCQDEDPVLSLSEAFNEDQLFSFDFSRNSRVPRLPEFAPWASDKGDIEAIKADQRLCQELQKELSKLLEGHIPEARGNPVAEVFTLEPLEYGKPNTLICFVSNIFPPQVTVSWQYQQVPVQSSSPTFLSAIDGLAFQAFSYLNFTPTSSDVFSCTVTWEGDLFSTIAFWVPQNPIPSELLENILCGIALGLGIVGIIVGTALIIYFQKPCASGAD
ncbi:HLA class II histocompatibility antigen, DM alpha chain isoform X2 [Phascolarctos cinereus]|uniref:HLA class II histocompatibility antigen, DM alpha chain isoform X2 n=1 Tax=Phascolarctos cinereus TaxID=38626 RepID=A0A6P5J777_PHACI|nr:HLA class II histocompatibility antigen, DM alpha chain isoform X2 [Phascolarctos cinereus]